MRYSDIVSKTDSMGTLLPLGPGVPEIKQPVYDFIYRASVRLLLEFGQPSIVLLRYLNFQ